MKHNLLEELIKFQFVDLKQNPVPYIAVMYFGVWLLIFFCERSRIEGSLY